MYFFYYANANANVPYNVQFLHVIHTIRTALNIDATLPSYTAVNCYSLLYARWQHQTCTDTYIFKVHNYAARRGTKIFQISVLK